MGESRSVSRVPGAAPRTSTPPTAAGAGQDDRAAGRPLRQRDVTDRDAGDGGERAVVGGRHRRRGERAAATRPAPRSRADACTWLTSVHQRSGTGQPAAACRAPATRGARPAAIGRRDARRGSSPARASCGSRRPRPRRSARHTTPTPRRRRCARALRRDVTVIAAPPSNTPRQLSRIASQPRSAVPPGMHALGPVGREPDLGHRGQIALRTGAR